MTEWFPKLKTPARSFPLRAGVNRRASHVTAPPALNGPTMHDTRDFHSAEADPADQFAAALRRVTLTLRPDGDLFVGGQAEAALVAEYVFELLAANPGGAAAVASYVAGRPGRTAVAAELVDVLDTIALEGRPAGYHCRVAS